MGKPTSPVVDLNAALLLLLLAAVWGGSFFFAEVALRELPPLVITLFRVSLAVPVLLMVVVLRGVPITRSLRVWRAYLVMGALNNAIPFSLIFWGQTQIESGLASILNGTTAMFGALIAGLLLPDEPLRANKLIGAALGLAGVAFIMGPDALQDFNLTNLAQLAILGATLSYAFASVWGKTTLAGQPPLMNALGMVVCSSVLMLPIVWFAHGAPSFAFQPATWGALLGLAVLSTALAYLLYFAILARAGAANLMLVTLLIPPFAITLGALFLSERIGIQAFAGFAVIAIGFAVTDGRLFARLRQRR
ncbi:DMT family transporter [Nereida sp. NH-UV-3]|uniref:DMT family transporter n=1 Tax=Nereida TaxID=282198 RepID=UPI0036F19F35